jgi:translation initiation factor 4G
MNLGRGDARNFSGGNQLTPPPDYQKNTVGMEDLRRLGNRNNSRQASQQGTISLGPSSMFNGRGSNNARKGFGPGMLGRGGEDSGASSRTATPPAQKKEREEKEAAHQNAFR